MNPALNLKPLKLLATPGKGFAFPWAGIFETTQAHRLQEKHAGRHGLTFLNGVGGFLMLNWPLQNVRLFITSFSVFPGALFRLDREGLFLHLVNGMMTEYSFPTYSLILSITLK